MPTVRTSSEIAHSDAVREMFSGIAGRYDLLNHLLSLNIDRRWRRAVARELQDILARPEAIVLDVACGTGDLSIELAASAKADVIGTDFCRPMLALADRKIAEIESRIPLVESDAMSLPFADESFDAVTIAFGLRNLSDTSDGLIELRRILKPGGRLVVLECSKPGIPGLDKLFNFYFSRILPRIGGLISGSRGAYSYLPASVARFPDQRKLEGMMKEVGFTAVSHKNLTGGVAALHFGSK